MIFYLDGLKFRALCFLFFCFFVVVSIADFFYMSGFCQSFTFLLFDKLSLEACEKKKGGAEGKGNNPSSEKKKNFIPKDISRREYIFSFSFSSSSTLPKKPKKKPTA